ncbi:MAG: hypothetical protein V9E96_17305 [Chitinophagaceae bacterium]
MNTKYTPEELAVVPIEEVRSSMIELQVPDAFCKKSKSPSKKSSNQKSCS